MKTKENALLCLTLCTLVMALLMASCKKDEDDKNYEDITDIPDNTAVISAVSKAAGRLNSQILNTT
jgi:hypothetical protein